MTAFGMPVEPDVNSSFPTVSGVIFAIDSSTALVTGVAARSAKDTLLMPSQGRSDVHDGDAGEIDRLQRLLKGRAVLHHHDGGLDQVEQIFEFGVILAHQRIGRRHRRGRQACLHRGLRHQRVLDGIAGEDRDGAAAFNTEIEQALRQRVDGALGFAVGNLSPLPVGAAALRQPDALGRLLRPFRERGRNVLLVRLQRNARLQDDDAVGPPLDGDVALQPVDLAKAGFLQHRGGIPFHFASPGILVLCGSCFSA